MREHEDGTLWIDVVEDQLELDRNEIIKIIEEYESNPNYEIKGWVNFLGDEIQMMTDKIREKVMKAHDKHVALSSTPYPNQDFRSVAWEVENKISSLSFQLDYLLSPEDLLTMKEFLRTPEGKELEGWSTWERYWENRESIAIEQAHRL